MCVCVWGGGAACCLRTELQRPPLAPLADVQGHSLCEVRDGYWTVAATIAAAAAALSLATEVYGQWCGQSWESHSGMQGKAGGGGGRHFKRREFLYKGFAWGTHAGG